MEHRLSQFSKEPASSSTFGVLSKHILSCHLQKSQANFRVCNNAVNLKDNNYFNTFFLLFIFLSSIFTSILKSCIPRINNLRFLIQSQLHHSTKVVTTRKFPQILFNDYELNPMFPPFFFFFVFFKPWLHCTQNYKLSKRKKMQLKTIRLKKK